MAEVVQLKENGELKYLVTHVKAVEGIDKHYQKKSEEKELWSGLWYGGASGNGVEPTKRLSDCANGWILQWQEMSAQGTANGTTYQFFALPKQHALNPGLRGTVNYLNNYNNTNPQVKYLYVNDATIKGNDLNAPDGTATGKGNKAFVLTKIYEY